MFTLGYTTVLAAEGPCPEPSTATNYQTHAYSTGYYWKATDFETSYSLTDIWLKSCDSMYKTPPNRNLCKAGVYDALQDIGKALRCAAESYPTAK